MKSSKNIKVYGTLVNHTLDSTLADETHNDALMNAYQLFDGRFGDSPLPNNFQDVINKRITDITFDGGTTTIENRDEVPENHYTFVVNGDTNLNGNAHVTENLHVDGDTYLGDTHVDGDLYVAGDITGINLDDLDDVDVPSPSTKDLLYFQNGLWRSGNISTVYGDDIVNIINNSSQVGWLSKLKDVNVIDRIDGQFLKYNVNGNDAKWIAANITLGDIDDIADLQNAADNYVLKFYNGKWRPRPDDSGTQLPEGSEGKVLKYINGSWVAADDNDTKQLSALNDVTLSTMAIGQVLRYDGSKWVNAKLSLSDLQMPTASNGQVLKFNGTEWVAGTDEAGGGGVSRLSDLSDVDTSGKQDGNALVYDSTSGKWKPGEVSSGGEGGTYIVRARNAVYHTYDIVLTRTASIPYFSNKCYGEGTGMQIADPYQDLTKIPVPVKNKQWVYISTGQDIIPSDEKIETGSVIMDETSLYTATYPSNTPLVDRYQKSVAYTVNGTTVSSNPSYASHIYIITESTTQSCNPVHADSVIVDSLSSLAGPSQNKTSNSVQVFPSFSAIGGQQLRVLPNPITDSDGGTNFFDADVASKVENGDIYGFVKRIEYENRWQSQGFTSRFTKQEEDNTNGTNTLSDTSISESQFTSAIYKFTVPSNGWYWLSQPIASELTPPETIIYRIITYSIEEDTDSLIETKTVQGTYVGSTQDIQLPDGVSLSVHSKYYYCQLSPSEASRVLNCVTKFKHSSGDDCIQIGGSYHSNEYRVEFGGYYLNTIPKDSWLVGIPYDYDSNFDNITGADMYIYLKK